MLTTKGGAGMFDLDEIRGAIRGKLDEMIRLQSEQDKQRSDATALAKAAEGRESGLTTDERDRITKAQAELVERGKTLNALSEELRGLRDRESEVEVDTARRRDMEKLAGQYGGTARTASLESVREPEIYRKGSQNSFFADMAFRFQDPDAMDRISKHQRSRRATDAEKRAASGSGDFGGMVIPAYLVEEFAPIAREGRPFANTVRQRELPPTGMTWTIPKGNTATIVGSQTTQNTAVSTQTYTVADLSGPIVTVAGSIAVSRQSLDRGTNVDMIVMEDLAGAYGAELDRQLIHGPGTNGTHYGVLATTSVSTLTVSSAGATTQLRQVAQAIGQVYTGRKRAASVIVVHPRRWAYWLQATDTTNRPLITAEGNGPFNTFGRGQFSEDLVAGYLHGLPVILDANISTTLSYDVTQSSTTDIVIVTRATDLILMEDNQMPTQVRYEETLASNLSVNIVAWGYSGFTAGRYPTASIVLAGSGLTTPATVG